MLELLASAVLRVFAHACLLHMHPYTQMHTRPPVNRNYRHLGLRKASHKVGPPDGLINVRAQMGITWKFKIFGRK